MTQWTIDELAREAGTTVRNIRVYQDRGLLRPPQRRGRVGVYHDDHLERLRLVLRLLDRGYPLATIRELIEAWDGRQGLGVLLGFDEALHRPVVDEAPARYTAEELATMFAGDDERGSYLARVIEVGIIEVDGDGFVTHAPGLVRAGAQLVSDGVPLGVVTDIGLAIWQAAGQLADRFVDAFVRWVWEPFAASGMPEEGWPRILSALDNEQQSITAAVESALGHAMRRATQAQITQRGDPLAMPPPPPGAGRRGRTAVPATPSRTDVGGRRSAP